ncbi:LANO_0G11782g1_1 [Lachancea nothofagi CBS 11611]|uniref:LANO_0G11782g1_1 n=1 Tax=Lachancea nothofagi CBS 11611 TaxID=1266666 RepID=A0A1G4KJN4_9SACH|nr:LANO_0G11782g1_1 [Lachancea nothofagi CBS 11611]
MLRATRVSSVSNNDIISILPISEASKVLVANKEGHVLVYSYEGNSLKLTHTYNHLMKNNGPDTVIIDLLYSHQLATVFALCEKSIVLLNSTNLNQFDRIVEKRGVKQAWVFEQPSETRGAMTALLLYPNKASKLKLFLWNDRSFTSVSELSLSSKDEVILSMEMELGGFLIATNVGNYYWRLKDLNLLKFTKIISPLWPQNIHDALKELDHCNHTWQKNADAASVSSASILSRKGSFGRFFQPRETRGQIQKVKLIFRPVDHQHVILLDGRSQKMFEVLVKDSESPQLSAREWRQFFEVNSKFDNMQHLSSNFLLLSNRESIRIVDYQYGFNYLDVRIEEGIKKVVKAKDSTLLVWTSADNLQIYKLIVTDQSNISEEEEDLLELEDGTITRSLKNIVFYESILNPKSRLALCEGFECDDFNNALNLFALKLRDMNVLWSLNSFERCQKWSGRVHDAAKISKRAFKLQEFIIKKIFDNFINFLAPPELVIGHCLPRFASKLLDTSIVGEIGFHKRSLVDELPASLINKWCLPYLTDTRRNLHNIATKGKTEWEIKGRTIEIDVRFFLLDHHEEQSVESLLRLIDTTIFNIYLEYNPSMLGPFTRVPNNCDFETVAEQLTKHKKIQELVDFYHMKGQHELALKLLTGLESDIKSVHPEDMANNIKKLVVDYLKKLSWSESTTLFKYTSWLLERFPENIAVIVTSIFMNFSPDCAKYDYMKVYDYIDALDRELSIRYLEFVIDAFGTTYKPVYMVLIERYLEDIDNHKTARKLEAILSSTNCYEPRNVLRLLEIAFDAGSLNTDSALLVKKLQTYPLKVLGEHKKSLKILFEELSNYHFSTVYCNEVFHENQDVGSSLFNTLFDMMINDSENNNQGPRIILRFLKEFGPKLNSTDILMKLPSKIPLKDMQQILAKEIESSSLKKNCVRLEKNLLQVQLVDQTSQLNKELANYCVITEEQKCFACHKLLKSSHGGIILWFSTHDGRVLTHYNCRKVMEDN